ncbi:MAG: sulfatase/phosphatase domain-containing protein, partial [Planctomycetota bacterium]
AVASWPSKIEGGARDTAHLVSGVDIAATVCDYAGAPPLPRTTIARSWRPLLEGKDVAWRDYVVGETSIGPLSVCVRDKRYKSIIYQDRTCLFDIQNDPLETKDLAAEPAHAHVKNRHRQQLREYLSQVEVYPGPADLEEQMARDQRVARRRGQRPRFARGNLYKAYCQWYEQLKSEG